MQEPWANIICSKPDRNIVGRRRTVIRAYSNDITSDGVDVVVISASRTAYHRERMLLRGRVKQRVKVKVKSGHTPWRWKGCYKTVIRGLCMLPKI